MDSQTARPYQQQLQQMRAALMAQIAEQRGGVMGRAEVAAEHFGHPEDSSAQMATERDIEFALGERELVELNAIADALARIDAGSYGECIDCTVAINPARLDATPEAPRCIQCQEKHEQHPGH